MAKWRASFSSKMGYRYVSVPRLHSSWACLFRRWWCVSDLSSLVADLPSGICGLGHFFAFCILFQRWGYLPCLRFPATIHPQASPEYTLSTSVAFWILRLPILFLHLVFYFLFPNGLPFRQLISRPVANCAFMLAFAVWWLQHSLVKGVCIWCCEFKGIISGSIPESSYPTLFSLCSSTWRIMRFTSTPPVRGHHLVSCFEVIHRILLLLVLVWVIGLLNSCEWQQRTPYGKDARVTVFFYSCIVGLEAFYSG